MDKKDNRGGPRIGAGRKPGSTGPYKEVTKKMYSFRLSEDEAEAVKNLLKEMRKKV